MEVRSTSDNEVMVARILSLLIAGLLILPQGICLCEFVWSCEAPAVAAECADALPCCHCKSRGANTEKPSELVPPCKAHSCPNHGPEHQPVCPTKDGTKYWKANLGGPADTSLQAVAFAPTLDVVEVQHPASHAAPTAFAVNDRPVYLTTLSLRI